MQNKSNTIVTPETSLKALVDSMDQALSNLDDATEHFKLTVLNHDDLSEEVKNVEDKDRLRELMELMENYALMSGFLIDHPLISVIKQIRDESKISDAEPAVMAIQANVEVGQLWKHYKGTTYKVVSVAKNANESRITDIHYTDQVGHTWSLPVHQFAKRVMWEGKEVSRFEFIG